MPVEAYILLSGSLWGDVIISFWEQLSGIDPEQLLYLLWRGSLSNPLCGEGGVSIAFSTIGASLCEAACCAGTISLFCCAV